MKFQKLIESKIGPLYLVASAKALHGVFWRETPKYPPVVSGTAEAKIMAQAEKELTEYFEGRRKVFEVPLDAEGTEFQRRVWERLAAIPFGKTKSYRDIASEMQNPKAVRAVGAANGRNPLSIIVPCHRVIASDGSLGGYAGGLDRKQKLLLFEKSATIVNGKLR